MRIRMLCQAGISAILLCSSLLVLKFASNIETGRLRERPKQLVIRNSSQQKSVWRANSRTPVQTTPEDNTSVLPDSIVELLPTRISQRFWRTRVHKRCNYARVEKFRKDGRAKFNVTGLKPVNWICDNEQCTGGLGDQFRGMASAYWQGLAVGFDLVTTWTWPTPHIPDAIVPKDQKRWRKLEQMKNNFSASEVLTMGRLAVTQGTICNWTNYSAVHLRTFRNVKPEGKGDCDFNKPTIFEHVKETSWTMSGIGCVFWHQFEIGRELEIALAAALADFNSWKVANNRTQQRVIAIHVRGGDKHMGGKEGDVGLENPYVSRLRWLNTTMVKALGACARERIESMRWEGDETYLLLSDNQDAKAEAAALWPGRVYSSPVVAEHPSIFPAIASGEHGGGRRRRHAHMGIWVDVMMAALCDFIVTSPSPNANMELSAFSMTASEIGMYAVSKHNVLTVNGKVCLEKRLRKKGFGCHRNQGKYC